MDAATEKKLREMLDKHEIWQVMLRYARGLDRLDVELARSCYFDDAIEDHGRFVGNVDDFIAWANGVAMNLVTTHHGLMNHYCDLVGNDAYCETYFLCTSVGAKSPHLLSTGRYVDHFQKRNGEWRIANRAVVVEGTYDIVGNRIADTVPSAYGPDEQQPARRDRGDVSYQRPLRPRQPRPLRPVK